MNENESGTPFEDFLRSVLGDEAAAEAARALQAQGFDPANLPAEFSDPARMRAAMGQFQFLMNTTAGPVNWRMVEDSAKQAAYASGDPSPTATEAEAARPAMTVADLWLDAVTDFASGPVTRDVCGARSRGSSTLFRRGSVSASPWHSTCRALCPLPSRSSLVPRAWGMQPPCRTAWLRCSARRRRWCRACRR